MKCILVILAHEQERDRVTSALKGAGFQVAIAENNETGLRKLHEISPDVVILTDEVDGQELCSHIVRDFSDVPIIVLGSGEELVRVAMLEIGADVYLNKPVSPGELVARVHSLLRRYEKPKRNPVLGSETNQVELRGCTIRLTPTEFRLFSCLLLNEGKVIPYQRLISEVWGEISLDNLHLYVRRLRQKLGTDSVGPYRLLNYRGEGYCLRQIDEK